MRRLTRWCFNGLCLLSLAACLGVAALWWRSCRIVDDAYLTTPGRTFVRVVSARGKAGLVVAKDWPRAELLHWRRSDDFGGNVGPFIVFEKGRDPWTLWKRWGLSGDYGTGVTLLGADGAPLTALPSDPSGVTESAPLREWSAFAPYWMAAACFAVMPLLWLIPRARRPHVLRRRRLGRCLRCGYDLTGNASGVCSECGTAVGAGRRVTA